MNRLLEVVDLHKYFKMGKAELQVLKGINFSINQGDLVVILGASGVGKSTLLHILGTLDSPTKGEIKYEGENIFLKEEGFLTSFRSRTIGFVFQFHHLLPEFSAVENVMIPLLIQGKKKKEARAAAEAILSEVGLSARAQHKPGELSGGEEQRVAVARAIVSQPKILLADEITGNLDVKTGEKIYELLAEINKRQGVTVVTVTHNLELAKKFPRKFELMEGKIREI